MRYYFAFFALCISSAICRAQQFNFLSVSNNINASFRGLSVVNDSVAWVSGTKGWVGRSTNGGRTWQYRQVSGYENCDFRSLYAFNENNAVIANAGSPAYILSTTDGGNTWTRTYENTDTAAFFDGIDFWNSRSGVIYGDPIKGQMLILITNDAGKSWSRLPRAPIMHEGEASFAASGTNVHCYGKTDITIATGGKVSRLLRSENAGQTWTSIPTPILQHSASTGIFSFAFSDASNGVIVGGDYRNDSLKKDHVFHTTDGGIHWQAPRNATGGYRECVLFITGNILVATGPGGTDISYDKGESWSLLSGDGFHVIKKSRKGNLIIAAGSKGQISLLHQ